jgi:hypothetical protein
VYREQHERKCPFCSEWMSATAPKCLNCGRLVDEADEEEDEPESHNIRVGWALAAVAALTGAVVVYLVLR